MMTGNHPTFLKQLLRDNRGTSLIETSIILPVLLLLVFISTDVAQGFMRKMSAQQSADRAVNFALSAGLSRATSSLIQSEAANMAGVSTNQVTVTLWLECAGVVQLDFNSTCNSGSPARYLSVAVTASYAPMFGPLLEVSSIPLRGFAEARLQ